MNLSDVDKDSRKKYSHSLELWAQAKRHIVPGSSTLSKRADLYPFGAYPIYLNRAEGATVEDVDGNSFMIFSRHWVLSCWGLTIPRSAMPFPNNFNWEPFSLYLTHRSSGLPKECLRKYPAQRKCGS